MTRKSQDKKESADYTAVCASVASGIVSCFIFLLLFVFPLRLHDQYFDLLETKYSMYYMSVLALSAVLLLAGVVMMGIDCKEYRGRHVRKFFSAFLPSNWKKNLSVADVAVIVFWAISGISTLLSPYQYEAFWGNEGRYSGFFLMTLYVLSYFLISRLWRFKEWYFQAFLISGVLMSILGIADYFNMDLMGYHQNMQWNQIRDFTSTIGNINTYTAYIAMLMGYAAAVFTTEKKLWKSIWYYACTILFFFAIMMGRSDNAYLAIGAMFIFLPYITFSYEEGLKRYLMVLAGFVTSVCCIKWINTKYASVVIGMDSAFKIFSKCPGLPVIALLIWVVVLALHVGIRKKGLSENCLGKRPKQIWTIFLAVCTLALIAVLLDANVAGHAERYASVEKYLVFKDDWGTRRGYIWKESLRLYAQLPFLQKLFGYGPDTFGILTHYKIYVQMINKYGEYFDSAHNEYIQYLLTIGPIGLGSYLVFLISSARSLMKKVNAVPSLYGVALALICYGFQASVNINLPAVTPTLWLLISMGAAGLRNKTTE